MADEAQAVAATGMEGEGSPGAEQAQPGAEQAMDQGQQVDGEQVQQETPPPVEQQVALDKKQTEQEKISRAYAKLSRDMRQVQQQSEQIKAMHRDLQPFMAAKQLVEKGDHAGALQALNIDISAAGRQIMEGENPSPETLNKRTMTKLEQLEAQNQQLQNALQQFQLQTEGSKIENEFNQIIKGDDYNDVATYYESWENENPTTDLVAILNHYREQEGKSLTMAEAAGIMKSAVNEKVRMQLENKAFCKLYGIKTADKVPSSPKVPGIKSSNHSAGSGLGQAPPATAAGQKPIDEMDERELNEFIKREAGWIRPIG